MENNGSGNPTSIKQLIQGMVPKEAELMQGKVISLDPLKIQMEGDEKHIIRERVVIIPRHLTDYETEITVQWSTNSTSGGSGDAAFASHAHGVTGRKKITVHNALKLDDKLHILSLNKGKLYFLLDKVVEE